jgi:FtsP/CotA-like multicopper oxidase with cupredoxin domain
VEKILILGELDRGLHTALDQGSGYNMLNYQPDCWIINGRCCPDTVQNDYHPGFPSQPMGSLVQARAGDRVLLRLLNAGFQNHTLHLGGLTGRVVAADSFPLISADTDASYRKTSVTLASGQGMDLIIIPEYPGSYYLYARELNHIVNNDSFPGGMMTKMVITA